MSKIDEMYKKIGDRIDKSISELEAIKNYSQVRDKLDALDAKYATLQSSHKLVLINVKTFRATIDGMKKYIADYTKEYEFKLLMKDEEIKKLKQALGFQKAAGFGAGASDPEKD
jgi:hypothetical protein